MIDPHVHLRDWNQSRKETLAHAFDLAWRCGISALFEMPNTDPPLTDRAAIVRRIADADRARPVPERAPFHGLYAGLTADPDQVAHVAAVHGELFPRVVGCKLYAGHSTGQMGVTTVAEQYTVWRTLARSGYRGVVAVHAEREDLLRPDLRIAEDPLTHSSSRPPLAEIASVQTQLVLAETAGFRGTVHICHVSTAETLVLVARERRGLPFTVTAGVTPHHLLLDTTHASTAATTGTGPAATTGTSKAAAKTTTTKGARDLTDPPGTGFTVNPPLRDRTTRERLLETVLAGNADWIESDHAPHTWEEKRSGAAGLPGIPALRYLKEQLLQRMDRETVYAMTAGRILEAFRIDPTVIPDHPTTSKQHNLEQLTPDPFTLEQFRSAAGEYPWDPYALLQ